MDVESIEVHVLTGYMPQEPLILSGFKSSDTVAVLIDKVKNLVFQQDIQPCYLPVHPALKSMVSDNGHAFQDDETLGFLSKYLHSNPISLHYIEHVDLAGCEDLLWLRLTKRARFLEEPHEPDLRIRDPEEVVRKPHSVSIVRRPISVLAPLPFAGDLSIHGQYVLLNSKKFTIPISDIEFAVCVKTSASVILLAPNSDIFEDLVSLNSKSEYLVIQISWDWLPYLFLRTLRTSYPDIPIVAVTDLDPHHLDLLTFLDTPPEDVLQCYGRDLSEDYGEDFTTHIEFVGIEWLGLRPDDCKDLRIDAVACRTPLPGFDEVIRMLRVNPSLRMKPDWLAALDWLNVFGMSVSFNSVSFNSVDFISRKLSTKDWV